MFIVNYLLLYILMNSWCKIPEDGDYAEICRSYVKTEYIYCRIVHLFVFSEVYIIMQGMKNVTVTTNQSNKYVLRICIVFNK